MLSPEGRERLLAVQTTGDIFGESCLSGLGPRLETATAMEETVIKQIPCSKFTPRKSPRPIIYAPYPTKTLFKVVLY